MDSILFEQVIHPNIIGELTNVFQTIGVDTDINRLPARYYKETQNEFIIQFRDSGEEIPIPDEMIINVHITKGTFTIYQFVFDYFPSRLTITPYPDGTVHWLYFPEVLCEIDLDMYHEMGIETSKRGNFIGIPNDMKMTEDKIEDIANEIPSKDDIYKYQDIFP